MKRIFFLLIVLISSFSYAQEFRLVCKGIVKWSGDEKPVEAIYELIIDEKNGTIPSFTVGLAPGCFESEYTSGVCSCKVTKSAISCESESRLKKSPSFLSKESFTINRYTGKMQTSTSAFAYNKYVSSSSGELTCEKIQSKKF